VTRKELTTLGGHARALALTAKRRKAIAKQAADARWAAYRKAHYGKKAKS